MKQAKPDTTKHDTRNTESGRRGVVIGLALALVVQLIGFGVMFGPREALKLPEWLARYVWHHITYDTTTHIVQFSPRGAFCAERYSDGGTPCRFTNDCQGGCLYRETLPDGIKIGRCEAHEQGDGLYLDGGMTVWKN